ncbi:hypothetical protein IAR55_003060 [Kwoniella newhampshirensis]|uniref:Cytochrome b5 heme-binding domain-containing protein n=1 Tax=Kwoniella newhampshirensis TaxID=1651941 RepID=A0AAW0YY64_9TREE
MSWLVPSIPGWTRPSSVGGPSTTPSASTSKPNGKGFGSGYEEEEEEEDTEDIDAPPPFPLPNSHQRSNTHPSFSVAPPSPPKSPSLSTTPPSDLNIAIIPDNVPLGNMAPPPSTIKKPQFGIQKGGEDTSVNGNGGDGLAASTTTTAGKKSEKKKRAKVALTPGHSALDWARLTGSGEDLRRTGAGFMRVTMSELKEHNTVDDAWSAFNGMVYNITAYLPFHPGGEDELMRVAGRDGTKLFMLTHSWVNLDYMLKECMVGVLVRG